MNVAIWILIGTSLLASASALLRWRKLRVLPNLSDEAFITTYREKFSGSAGSNDLILSERRRVAKVLGIPVAKLSPDHKFDELSKYGGFVGESEVGMGELGDTIVELSERCGMEAPKAFPKTVGEFIFEVARRRERRSED